MLASSELTSHVYGSKSKEDPVLCLP